MPTVEAYNLTLRYPEFEEIDHNRIDLFLLDAKMEVSQVRWGKLYQRGVLALAAHLLRLSLWTTEMDGGANRNIASENAGELSVSYVAPALTGTDADYQLTAYGQEYLRLRRLVGIGVMVA
ncbi:hypothetical protein BKG91_09405 [Rodentibacter caecimuris]|uniref:Uncharacterized protein n=1 Tax=Rodentibacter caecimuris TaxID=1796644 RepID=A0A9X8YYV5_9PAST|nr:MULTISPECIES: DUF4054 domain-containing protein [Pasteurellaceae]AOF54437.1 hypothetical protein AC062_2351 [Pasteurellaceae bacterium NI1060]MCR1838534.1 DUF4054 domain-containing protein [Pasteurella caecimuris]MCU0107845.1 DUF4054 domain-containing protein [Pasteurella caecimuris]OOF72378.1 hypothetical protein BKG90_04615 [Rodentibacter heylii]OOF73357.1 hypothetical protein BKG91_09405 [Rodentibacter heylii]